MTGQPKDHLAPGGAGSDADADLEDAPADESRADRAGTTAPVPAQPGGEAGSTDAAARGHATRSPAEVATRRHLEGSEQGPM